MTDKPFRSGYIAILGRPNVGKSTLMNRVLREKISIVTYKPQTTRSRILGILSEPGYQILFLDTPGVHRREEKGLDGFMLREAWSALEDADILLFITEASSSPSQDRAVIDRVKSTGKPTVCLLNKADLVHPKERLLPTIEAYRAEGFDEIIPTSATEGDGLDETMEAVHRLLPEGPAYYPEDILTDRNTRFVAAELIREKVFVNLKQEIPYSTAVEVESFKERPDGMIHIRAVIHVEKQSQKGILIGKGGAMLKRIGQQARQDLERFLGVKVYLELTVKLTKNWTKNPAALREFGYSD